MIHRNFKYDINPIHAYLKKIFNSNEESYPNAITIGRIEPLRTSEQADFVLPFNDILPAHEYLLKQLQPIYSYVNSPKAIGFNPIDENFIPLVKLFAINDIKGAIAIIEATTQFENSFIKEVTHFFYGKEADNFDIMENIKRTQPTAPEADCPPTIEEGSAVINGNLIFQKMKTQLLNSLKNFEFNSRVTGFNQPKQEVTKVSKNLILSLTEVLIELIEYETILLKKIRDKKP